MIARLGRARRRRRDARRAAVGSPDGPRRARTPAGRRRSRTPRLGAGRHGAAGRLTVGSRRHPDDGVQTDVSLVAAGRSRVIGPPDVTLAPRVRLEAGADVRPIRHARLGRTAAVSSDQPATSSTGPSSTQRAVDTVRVLAMDAVQKVGNGHPGTAMSLAPAAYLLFQKVMRHNPADPALAGPRPVRAVLRALQPDPLHPALPRRLGPRARRPQVAAHLGQQDPGPPRVRPHRRRRDHHRPARPGRRQRGRHGDGRPPRARPARPRRRARRAASSTTRSTPSASDGDIEEGVSAEASSLAGTSSSATSP